MQNPYMAPLRRLPDGLTNRRPAGQLPDMHRKAVSFGLEFLAATIFVVLTAGHASAITHCKAKSLEDGTIAVSARDVVGTPVWGTRFGSETTPFDGAVTCLVDGKAKNCALAAVGMPERTELPPSCTLYLADDGAEACSVWIKRCYASSEPLPCAVFPADNIWNRDISAMPVHASSAAWISSMGAGLSLHPDFGAGPYRNRILGIPYAMVSASQPPVAMSFLYADESDPGPYPVPFLVPVEGGTSKPSKGKGDAHVLLVDEGTCNLYEIYASKRQPDGSWEAGSGAVFDLSSNALRDDTWTSADAAGLPILPGLAMYDEVASGVITHALRFTAATTQRAYVWPARHYASSQTDPDLPPMGIRVRLKASVDISGFSTENQVILTALKTYGMMLADNGSSWFVSGAPDRRWDDEDLHALQTLHGSDFEVVDVSSLMVDPDSGQAAP
jgi:hypothetical protein